MSEVGAGDIEASLADGCPFAIGIDIGGTKIAAGVVASDGMIIENTLIPTPQHDDGPAVLRSLLSLIGEMRARHECVQAIGVGAAGLVDWPDGQVRWAPNISYRELPLQELLRHHTGLPAVVENDANAAAWAEACLGAGAGHRDVIVLTVGTGLGGGLILDGMLRRGQTGIGAEVGHVIVDPDGGLQCGCGVVGCLEARASGTALGRAGRAAAATEPTGLLATLAGGAEHVTGETVYQAACLGDATARQLFDQLGYWLGVGIASLVTLFDPEVVIVGGGLVTAEDLLLHPTRSAFERFVFARAHRTLPPIRPAKLGTDAGIIGSALLALSTAKLGPL
jgi:glucokinase